ncbi:MAG: site-specific integrase [Gemmataceae bacterium]|nr:site-specific integrase [Gemmataceae bacterium]
MARRSEPWFREERGQWYVWHEGKQVRLGPDEDPAFDAWHDLMALSRVTTAGDKNPFSAVAERFLDWISRNKTQKTYKTYRPHLQAFIDVHGGVELRDLKAVHVDDLMKRHPGWGKSTQRGVMVCILTCLNWAVRQGIASKNPLADKLDIPPIISRGRDSVIPTADYEAMVAHANGPLRDFLIACRNSGTRPHMVAAVTAKHFHEVPFPSWVFGDHKTKDSGDPLVVVLNPTLVALTKKLAAERPDGPLFLNNKGNPWTDTAIGKAMAALRQKLKAAGVKLSGTGIMYGFRHTYATELLMKGVPEAHVAGLLGHKSTAMLSKHYSHLSAKIGSFMGHLKHLGAVAGEAPAADGDIQSPALPAGPGVTEPPADRVEGSAA